MKTITLNPESTRAKAFLKKRLLNQVLCKAQHSGASEAGSSQAIVDSIARVGLWLHELTSKLQQCYAKKK